MRSPGHADEPCPARKPTARACTGSLRAAGMGLAARRGRVERRDLLAFGSELGLIPAVISPYVVSAMGERAARRYFLTGERFDAAEAWRLGLVHELASDDADLDEKVGDIVDAMLACGPVAQREAKELVRAVAARPVTREVIENTAERIARIRSSPEGREGVGAFLEKRPPAWIPPEPETMPEPEPPPV